MSLLYLLLIDKWETFSQPDGMFQPTNGIDFCNYKHTLIADRADSFWQTAWLESTYTVINLAYWLQERKLKEGNNIMSYYRVISRLRRKVQVTVEGLTTQQSSLGENE